MPPLSFWGGSHLGNSYQVLHSRDIKRGTLVRPLGLWCEFISFVCFLCYWYQPGSELSPGVFKAVLLGIVWLTDIMQPQELPSQTKIPDGGWRPLKTHCRWKWAKAEPFVSVFKMQFEMLHWQGGLFEIAAQSFQLCPKQIFPDCISPAWFGRFPGEAQSIPPVSSHLQDHLGEVQGGGR